MELVVAAGRMWILTAVDLVTDQPRTVFER